MNKKRMKQTKEHRERERIYKQTNGLPKERVNKQEQTKEWINERLN